MRYLLIILLISNQIYSSEIGTWKDYYSYNGAKKFFIKTIFTVIQKSGLFSYDNNNNELVLFSKLNFTNDFGIINLAFRSNAIVISYENSNIDIIEII